MMKHFFVLIIDLYQRTFSPDTGWFKKRFPGGFCKFEPHCSEYGKQAIEKYGIWRGSLMSVWRIMRCNPFSKGGADLVK